MVTGFVADYASELESILSFRKLLHTRIQMAPSLRSF